MNNDGWTWTREVEIASEKAAGEQMVQEVLDKLERNEWCERDIFAVHLSFEEALVNAIKHGNGFDASKMVRIICKISEDRIRIEVTDEGKGFRPDAVPDPTADENLDRTCGRGVHLMRNFMSAVHYNDTGNSVVMEKIRES